MSSGISLVCISLMTYDVKNFFVCSFAMSVSSLVRCLLRLFVHFSIGLFVFLLLNFTSSLYILVLCEICLLQILSPRRQLVFSSSSQCLSKHKFFYFNEAQFISTSFHGSCLLLSRKLSPRSSQFSPVL